MQIISLSAFVTIEKDTKIADDKNINLGLYIQKRNGILQISNFLHDHAKIGPQGKIFKMGADNYKAQLDLINQANDLNKRYTYNKNKNRGKKTKDTQVELKEALNKIGKNKLFIQ